MKRYFVGHIELIPYDVVPMTKRVDFVINEIVNDMTIINQSTNVNIYVNETLLVPGQEYNTGGNFGEIHHQPYKIRFEATGIALPTPAPVCIVLRKKYLNVKVKDEHTRD